MKFVCKSILTLLAFYVLYSECITLPNIIKKNKKLVYLLIGLVYLSTYNTVEGVEGAPGWLDVLFGIVGVAFFFMILFGCVIPEMRGKEGACEVPIIVIVIYGLCGWTRCWRPSR